MSSCGTNKSTPLLGMLRIDITTLKLLCENCIKNIKTEREKEKEEIIRKHRKKVAEKNKKRWWSTKKNRQVELYLMFSDEQIWEKIKECDNGFYYFPNKSLVEMVHEKLENNCLKLIRVISLTNSKSLYINVDELSTIKAVGELIQKQNVNTEQQ